MVVVVVEGEDLLLGYGRAVDCGVGGVDLVNGSSVSIAFELMICGARGGGGSAGGGGGENSVLVALAERGCVMGEIRKLLPPKTISWLILEPLHLQSVSWEYVFCRPEPTTPTMHSDQKS